MDPLEARDLFPLSGHWIFLNHAGTSPLSARSRAAVEQVAQALAEKPYPDGWWREESDRLREAAARLIHADAEQIAITRSTSHGISLLAGGLDWRPGDNVVGVRGEYPANVYPWMALRDRGVEFRMAEPVQGRVLPESVLELVDGRTRVVAVSHVEFWNGYRVDLQTIGEECRQRGVAFCVDAMQSCGALALDMERMPVDFLATGAGKWLLGPQGIGFCYAAPHLLERIRPVVVGVGSVRRFNQYFEYELDFQPNGRRFEESSLSLLDMTALAAAIELLLEVSTAAIQERVLDLSERLAEGLAALGYQVLDPWPRERAESSGIVSFRKPGSSPQEVMRDLNAAQVVGRIHQDFVRLAPHFWNTEGEVDRVLEVLTPQKVIG